MEVSKPPRQKPPFTPEGLPLFSPAIAEELEELIPTMGAQGPTPLTSEKPIRVEEEFEITERRAFTTSTTPAYFDMNTTEPKLIRIIVEGDDHYVDFNQQISGDSPKIFKATSQDFKTKGVVRIWFQAVTSTGTIRLLISKR